MVSFVDPIHSLITLEGKDEDCLEAIGPGFERLKKMKQLGWVSEAFPGARHSKWEHAMGTYHLGTLATASGRHVPGVDAHQFRVACADHVVGTPAYGYPSARGILMAMESSAKVRSQVTNLCTSVSERLTKLPGGSEVNWLAFARRPDTESIQRWFAVDDLVTRIPNRDGGALVIGVARTLLDRTQLANRFVDLFHTLDYVLRDLYNTGIANLRMNYELILETIQHVTNPEELDGILQGMPEWQVVESVRELLTLQVYWDSQVLTAETVFAKAIAKALADGLFEISALQIDDDESLYSRLMNTKI